MASKLIKKNSPDSKEKWLWKNKTALNQVKKGLKDAASGKVKSRGSFAKYVEPKLSRKKRES